MKKITLVLATMLLSISSATATQITADKNSKILRITNRYNQARPIQFVERGIEFLVFPNGEFDFNTEGMRGRHVGNYYGRKTRRGAYNIDQITLFKIFSGACSNMSCSNR